jgi:class 3 adenylate cyclase/FixJ family two-component response regulator
MRKPVILCVDDEKIILTSLKEQLRRHFQNEYAIETVESGEEALEILDELLTDTIDMPVVISDHIMPGIKGDELLKHIHTRSPRTLKILLTGQANADAVGSAVNYASLYRYIAKPWEEADLTLTVAEAVRSYFQDKKLEEQNAILQKMNQELEHLNAAYGKFVPHEFLSLLNKQSILDVQLGDQMQQEMTVLFSDIRGFTSLSEQMTPEDNFRFINAYLGYMGPIVRHHNGIIDKFIGDAIMALFPNKADDAVKAAIAMLRTLREYNQARQESGKVSINVGIGINTGSLMLGVIGEHNRMDSTVISDSVNLASRLEGLTKTFDVSLLISENTLKGLADPAQYHSRFLGKVHLKGKHNPVPVFEIYDGDPEPVIALKLKTTSPFEGGVQHYFAKEFAEAAVLFKNILKENPADKTAQLYLENSAQFMVHGVPDDWQGVQAL